MEYNQEISYDQAKHYSNNNMESTNSEDGDYPTQNEYGEEFDYPEEEELDLISRENSDAESDADKYVDRNSDPGVHVEQNFIPYDMGNAQMNTLYSGMEGDVKVGEGGMAMTTAGGGESVSLGTATQTHEVRMPMLTSTFVSSQ